MPWRAPHPLERFEVAASGCWLWTGSIDTMYGYGRVTWNGKRAMAHRVIYELLVGPIPDGKQPDHLCRVRHCVNPDDLELVTVKTNILRGESPSAKNARKTHCIAGHPFDEANTYMTKDGRRMCRSCNTRRTAESCRRRRKVS